MTSKMKYNSNSAYFRIVWTIPNENSEIFEKKVIELLSRQNAALWLKINIKVYNIFSLFYILLLTLPRQHNFALNFSQFVEICRQRLLYIKVCKFYLVFENIG